MNDLVVKLIGMGFDRDSFMVVPKDAEYKKDGSGENRPVLSREVKEEFQKLLRDKSGQRDTPGVIGYNNGLVAVYDGDSYIISANYALGQALEKEGFKDRGLGVVGSNNDRFANKMDNDFFEQMVKRCKSLETGDTEIMLAERAKYKAELLAEEVEKSNRRIEELNKTRFDSKYAAENAAEMSSAYEKVMALNSEYAKGLIAKGKQPNPKVNSYIESMLKAAAEGKKTEAENPLAKKDGFFKSIFRKKDKAEEAQLAALRQELGGLQEVLQKNPALVQECLQSMQSGKVSFVAHMAETLKAKAAEYKAREQESAKEVAGERENNANLGREKFTLENKGEKYLAQAKQKVADRIEFLSEDKTGEKPREVTKLSEKMKTLSGRNQTENRSSVKSGGKTPARLMSVKEMAAVSQSKAQR